MRGHKLKIQQSDNLKRSVFLAIFGFLAITGSIASAANVGFETIQVSNGTEPPLAGGVWHPTTAPAREHSLGFFSQSVAVRAPILGHDLPLVVLSHGGGSSYEAHYDTALALAHAGSSPLPSIMRAIPTTTKARSCDCGAARPSFGGWCPTCWTNGPSMGN
jgi:predicted dienelactone hydrolase